MLHPSRHARATVAGAAPVSHTGLAQPRPAACGSSSPARDTATTTQTQVRTATNRARVDSPISVTGFVQRFELGKANVLAECVADGALERRFCLTVKDSDGGPTALVVVTIPPEAVNPWQPDADGALTLLPNTLELDRSDEESP